MRRARDAAKGFSGCRRLDPRSIARSSWLIRISDDVAPTAASIAPRSFPRLELFTAHQDGGPFFSRVGVAHE